MTTQDFRSDDSSVVQRTILVPRSEAVAQFIVSLIVLAYIRVWYIFGIR
jgi:hypothetical protein